MRGCRRMIVWLICIAELGLLAQFMARQAAHVQGVEVVAAAIEDAKRNAARNGIVNVDFVCADAGEYAARIADSGERVDVVCVDPPRKGCDERTLEAMLTIGPGRIVYVSCDPVDAGAGFEVFGGAGDMGWNECSRWICFRGRITSRRSY